MLNFTSFVEALKGNQHKIDKNKNGKVDAHDFKLLRKEEVQIDEAKNHAADYDKHMSNHYKAAEKGDWDAAESHAQKAESAATRHFKSTGKKIYDPGYSNKHPHITSTQVKEESIEELNKSTLSRYVAAAQQDNKDHADSRRSGDEDEAKWAKDRMVKRSTGIGAAKNRLNKEEVEQIEERNKENAAMRKMMDASRGARFKNQQGTTVPDPEPQHKTAQAHNKAIGRAIRKMSEDTEIDENAFDWKSKKSEPSSGRYEIKRVNGKTIVTRKYNPETGHSTGTDDGEPEAQKRGRGRPAGSKNR